jgi:cytochrome c biogenesis protein CcmG/thiol:disulfide interchange protein DsbE
MTTPTTVEDKAPRKHLPVWVIAVAFFLLIGFLVLIGLGLRRVQAGPIVIGQSVPKFDLTDFDGNVHSTADYSGKVVVINFWASWCQPCEEEAAEMESAYQYYKDRGDVVFLGVDWVDTEPEARAYLEKFGVSYINGPDLQTKISQIFRITGVPETYILDQKGRLSSFKSGPFQSLAEIQSMIDPLLE